MKRLLIFGVIMATFTMFGAIITVRGDEHGARAYLGEANRYLYQLRMNNKTGTYAMPARKFSDGTVIKVKAAGGNDYVDIYKPLVPSGKEVVIEQPQYFIAYLTIEAGYYPAKVVLYTKDGEKEWQRQEVFDAWHYSNTLPKLAIHPSGIVVVGSMFTEGAHVYTDTIKISHDFGKTWKHEIKLEDQESNAGFDVAIGRDKSIFYVKHLQGVSATYNIFKSTDGGATFSNIENVSPEGVNGFYQYYNFFGADSFSKTQHLSLFIGLTDGVATYDEYGRTQYNLKVWYDGNYRIIDTPLFNYGSFLVDTDCVRDTIIHAETWAKSDEAKMAGVKIMRNGTIVYDHSMTFGDQYLYSVTGYPRVRGDRERKNWVFHHFGLAENGGVIELGGVPGVYFSADDGMTWRVIPVSGANSEGDIGQSSYYDVDIADREIVFMQERRIPDGPGWAKIFMGNDSGGWKTIFDKSAPGTGGPSSEQSFTTGNIRIVKKAKPRKITIKE